MIFVGNVLVVLDDEKERLLRELAREKYNGKKGAISATVAEGIEALAKKDKRFKAIENQLALMEKGFDFGLKNKKAYTKRSEIYD